VEDERENSDLDLDEAEKCGKYEGDGGIINYVQAELADVVFGASTYMAVEILKYPNRIVSSLFA
jgi:hypothetical protein